MQEKQQFVNATPHTVGYNCFEPGTGKPTALVLFPGETCWLSEDEQRMTANAPRAAKDNPFVAGLLTAVTDERPIPAANERPIAGIVGGAVQRPSDHPKTGHQPEEPPESIFENTEEDRAAKARLEAERQGRLGAVPAAQVEEPEQAHLAGDMGEDAAETVAEVEEETAQEEEAAREGEEVGAAVEPEGEPEQGEYAEHEEVGDPEAPEAAGTPFRNGQGSVANGTRNKKRRNRR